jgi:hypothetical protein
VVHREQRRTLRRCLIGSRPGNPGRSGAPIRRGCRGVRYLRDQWCIRCGPIRSRPGTGWPRRMRPAVHRRAARRGRPGPARPTTDAPGHRHTPWPARTPASRRPASTAVARRRVRTEAARRRVRTTGPASAGGRGRPAAPARVSPRATGTRLRPGPPCRGGPDHRPAGHPGVPAVHRAGHAAVPRPPGAPADLPRSAGPDGPVRPTDPAHRPIDAARRPTDLARRAPVRPDGRPSVRPT